MAGETNKFRGAEAPTLMIKSVDLSDPLSEEAEAFAVTADVITQAWFGMNPEYDPLGIDRTLVADRRRAFARLQARAVQVTGYLATSVGPDKGGTPDRTPCGFAILAEFRPGWGHWNRTPYYRLGGLAIHQACAGNGVGAILVEKALGSLPGDCRLEEEGAIADLFIHDSPPGGLPLNPATRVSTVEEARQLVRSGYREVLSNLSDLNISMGS
jgi:hypothetical protein